MKKYLLLAMLVLFSIFLQAQPSPPKVFTVTLSQSQVNVILNALSDRKISEAFDTYMSLQLQVTNQMAVRVQQDTTTIVKPKENIKNKK